MRHWFSNISTWLAVFAMTVVIAGVGGTSIADDAAGVVRISDFAADPRPISVAASDGNDDDESDFPEMEPQLYEGQFSERVEFDPNVPHDMAPIHWGFGESLLEVFEKPAKPLACFYEWITCAEHVEVETPLHDHAEGLQEVPARPALLLETNERFLAPGFLEQGIELPTGAVWRPALWVFGQFRTGISYQDNRAGTNFTEWSSRLDLFGQLNLSGTERVLLGLRPLDEQRSASRSFAGYDFHSGEGIEGANADIQTLFFEGDFGEIFPNLDCYDCKMLDIGFSVGRQTMSFQQGLLINEDLIDAVTVTRNTLTGNGNLNLRISGVYGWKEINRNNNMHDPDAQLIGLFTESDFASTTVNADVAYVQSQTEFGSVIAFGLSAIQRLHEYHNTYNSSAHVLGSYAIDGETSASGNGLLLFNQFSWTPHHTEDLVYINGFWAIDQFTSPARGQLAGGPLGQTGILFSAAGLGQFGAPLSNQASDAAGGSIGYQLFFDDLTQQVVFEIGGRKDTNNIDAGQYGFGTRYQKALNQHWIFVLDGFGVKTQGRDWAPGSRIEFLAKF